RVKLHRREQDVAPRDGAALRLVVNQAQDGERICTIRLPDDSSAAPVVDARSRHAIPRGRGFPIPIAVAEELLRSHVTSYVGTCHPDKPILQDFAIPAGSRIWI